MNAEQRFDWLASIDPQLARARRMAQLAQDPDIEVKLV